MSPLRITPESPVLGLFGGFAQERRSHSQLMLQHLLYMFTQGHGNPYACASLAGNETFCFGNAGQCLSQEANAAWDRSISFPLLPACCSATLRSASICQAP